MSVDDLIARDREAELALIRDRRLQRDELRRLHRRRRAVAVALLAFPIAAFALASAWPTRTHTARPPASSAASGRAAPPAAKPAAASAPRRFPMPTEVRAAHVSVYAASKPGYLKELFASADPKGLNAVEIDIKDEGGVVGFVKSAPALARRVGAAQPYYNARATTAAAHRAGLYVIGRIVTFQDPILAPKLPGYAIRSKHGGIWTNARGFGWLNPYDQRAWRYAIDLGAAAARAGFDEIQFDYVRFPTDGDLSTATFAHRRPGPLSRTIESFATAAVAALHPLGVRVSTDLFGLAATRDVGIGQNPRHLAKIVDVVCPMVYPSGYGPGQYNIADPPHNPHDVVAASLADWQRALAGSRAQLRPWLQDYSYGGVSYGASEVRSQVRAVREAGGRGFSLWNASSVYTPGVITAG